MVHELHWDCLQKPEGGVIYRTIRTLSLVMPLKKTFLPFPETIPASLLHDRILISQNLCSSYTYCEFNSVTGTLCPENSFLPLSWAFKFFPAPFCTIPWAMAVGVTDDVLFTAGRSTAIHSPRFDQLWTSAASASLLKRSFSDQSRQQGSSVGTNYKHG